MFVQWLQLYNSMHLNAGVINVSMCTHKFSFVNIYSNNSLCILNSNINSF